MSNLPHQDRTIPEQVEFAYLTLLGHLEHLASRMQEIKDGAADIDIDCIESLHDQVNRMLCKNYKLRFKLQQSNSNPHQQA